MFIALYIYEFLDFLQVSGSVLFATVIKENDKCQLTSKCLDMENTKILKEPQFQNPCTLSKILRFSMSEIGLLDETAFGISQHKYLL